MRTCMVCRGNPEQCDCLEVLDRMLTPKWGVWRPEPWHDEGGEGG